MTKLRCPRFLVSATAGILLLSLACSKQPDTARQAEEERAQPAAEAAKEPVEEAPRANLLNPASLTERAPNSFQVRFATSKGDFVVKVTRAWAPIGADRFYNLVKAGFFDEARFFRVLPDFVVQFGLPADPAVARVWQSATLRDDQVTQSNKKGTLTFATGGPNTRTTQLFINLKDNAFLDQQGFSPFGEVVEGMKVVESLYSGYGEIPSQEMVTMQGNAYLKANFPKMDYTKSATVE